MSGYTLPQIKRHHGFSFVRPVLNRKGTGGMRPLPAPLPARFWVSFSGLNVIRGQAGFSSQDGLEPSLHIVGQHERVQRLILFAQVFAFLCAKLSAG